MGATDGPRTRREYLGDVLAGGAALGAAGGLAGCTEDTPGTDTLTGTAEDTTRVRHSIETLQNSDPNGIIPAFREAVKKMKALPSSDPRNWANQVQIHGSATAFLECEHGNWLFLPWHRLYLYHFESICRDLTGNDHFALPYWNWAKNHRLPSIFGQSAGSITDASGNNPLYNPTRVRSPGDSITTGPYFPSDWGVARMEQDVLGDPNFQRAVGGGGGTPTGSGGSALEGHHGSLHVWVGGEMSGGNSPNDPIFWTHHCFVDCVWWEWNARRGNPNPNHSDWVDGIEVGGTGPAFPGDFVDYQQNSVTGSAATSLAGLLMPLLSYRYEAATKGATPTPSGGVAGAGAGATRTPEGTLADSDELRKHLEEGADVELERIERFPVAEGLEFRAGEPVEVFSQIPPDALRPVLTGEEPGELLLTATDVKLPPRPDLVTLVFVNRPGVFAEPTSEDPGFAGQLTFFGAESMRGGHTLAVNVTGTLRRLDERGEFQDGRPPSFQFVTVPVDVGREDLEGERVYAAGALSLDVTQSVIDGQVVER